MRKISLPAFSIIEAKKILIFIFLFIITSLAFSFLIFACSTSNGFLSNIYGISSDKQQTTTHTDSHDKFEVARNADYTSLENLTVSLSYPLYSEPKQPSPAAFTGGGDLDISQASDSYKLAKMNASRIAQQHDNSSLPLSSSSFANCSAFTATVIINTIDQEFPGNYVKNQRQYVSGKNDGWSKIAESEDNNLSRLEPGDIFISKQIDKPGHTWIWLGDYGGVKNVIAEASYGSTGSDRARLPNLRSLPLDSSGIDDLGRSYGVWRYVG